MKKINFSIWAIIALFVVPIIFSSCEKTEDDETPTQTKMQGVWLVAEAYDSSGTSIMDKVENQVIPITAFWLQSDNTVYSTSGPMTTYLVYGDHQWSELLSKFDQVWNYASLNFTNGEFFVANGVVERFALEMKLQGLPGASGLETILNIFGIQSQWLTTVVYHKFLNVKVSFNEANDRMIWTFDDSTVGEYNMKDSEGHYVLWEGWPVANFSRCSFVLEKKSTGLNDLVTAAYESNK